MPTTTDLLGLAIDKNPVDFADTFNALMMQKAAGAIEARQIDLAQSMYGGEGEVDDDEFEDFDVTDIDDEEAVDDLDDIDLDLELDDVDLDVEDFTDDDNE